MATLTFAQTRWWAARFRLRPVLAGDAPCSQSLQSAYLTALSKVRPLRGMVFFNACVKDDRCAIGPARAVEQSAMEVAVFKLIPSAPSTGHFVRGSTSCAPDARSPAL